MKAISEKKHWDDLFLKYSLPRKVSRNLYNHRVTIDYLHPFLEKYRGSSFLEVGCGASAWLPFFATEYSLLVSGIDYSEEGCRIAAENLNIQQIPYSDILCRDILHWDSEGRFYDIIFSYGVIEHFDKPNEIVKVFSHHLAPGGLMITLVPNLCGLNGLLSRCFCPKVHAMHKVIDRSWLSKMHSDAGMEIVAASYVGTLSFSVTPWDKSWFSELFGGRILNIAKLFSCYFDLLTRKIGSLGRREFPSRIFSPYVIVLAKSKSTE